MKRATVLESTKTPDGSTMELVERDGHHLLRVNGRELMSTRHSYSEEQLGVVACQRLAQLAGARVLIGGLGLGFTLRATLETLGEDAEVVVAELLPQVVEWNRNVAYPLASASLADARTKVVIGDVANIMAQSQVPFDAIMLDADNQTTTMNTPGNTSLYHHHGIGKVWNKLKPGGTVVYWSPGEDPTLAKQLASRGFVVEVQRVRRHPSGSGGHHFLLIGQRRT